MYIDIHYQYQWFVIKHDMIQDVLRLFIFYRIYIMINETKRKRKNVMSVQMKTYIKYEDQQDAKWQQRSRPAAVKRCPVLTRCFVQESLLII